MGGDCSFDYSRDSDAPLGTVIECYLELRSVGNAYARAGSYQTASKLVAEVRVVYASLATNQNCADGVVRFTMVQTRRPVRPSMVVGQS